ncbi:MAG: ATP-dependent helicase [Bacteroidia bacterium]|nr:ATP-dependent helicase [Bacteroidia bacterium]
MQKDLFSANRIKAKYEDIFNKAYNSLNPRQKKAVDTVEGPVLVNAGPGTGKTQILATRIGKILKDTDTAPHNILCLTFTDAATVAMRNRLVEIIGPTAHQVHIFTFHGFCNQVIQENLDIFGGYRQLEPITDLEAVDLYRELIDNLKDDNPLKRFKYDKYFETSRLKNLFDLMKKENLSPSDMHQKIADFFEMKKDSEEFIAKRKYTNKEGKTFLKGDFRDDKFEKLKIKYVELEAAIDEFENYSALMKKAERYDFNDMIRWVLEEFKSNEYLLLKYQERYQYFLVDEYQDTNGAQNAILKLLISYWDSPNVFTVGDDDQAIYKFQGANLGNIMDFKEAYNPEIVILEQNYRSNQNILDASKSLITFNSERLIAEDPNLSKELKASGPFKDVGSDPQLLAFDKVSEEYAFLASELESLYKNDPETFSDTAVIYRKHKQVDDLVNVLEKRNIPFNIKRRVNILEIPFVKNLINVLYYLSDEYNKYGFGQHRLFEILHYNYFNIHSLDIGRIALFCKTPNEENIRPEWRSVITDEKTLDSLNLKKKEAVLKIGNQFDKWINEIPEITLQALFGKVLNEGGVLNYVMTQDNKSWLLQIISTLFEFIKTETARNPNVKLKELLAMIDKMNENKITLSVNKIITSEKGIKFITAHSAKGLEFRKVYMIGCTKNIWDDNSRVYGHYSYPEGINADNKTNVEDERRLFYVGMTRAKTDLTISFARNTEEGKELGASQFVDEILASTELKIDNPEVSEDVLAEFYFNLLLITEKKIPLIEQNLIDEWLNGFKLSVTHLNKYLRCPLSFYFETILRVPTARNAPSGFGTAMHDALHHFLLGLHEKGEKDVSHLLYHFEKSMVSHKSHFTDDEYESYLTHGKNTLNSLYENKFDHWNQVEKIALEEEISHAEHEGIPLKGFLDKVEIHKDYVHVVDYKTGKYRKDKLNGPNEKEPNGGDYWRQLVFYKMLLDSDKKHDWNMVSGEVDFIEPDRKSGKFTNYKYVVSPEDLEVVGEQIVETHKNIKAYNFDTTCEEETCTWCRFVRDNYTLDEDLLINETEL